MEIWPGPNESLIAKLFRKFVDRHQAVLVKACRAYRAFEGSCESWLMQALYSCILGLLLVFRMVEVVSVVSMACVAYVYAG